MLNSFIIVEQTFDHSPGPINNIDKEKEICFICVSTQYVIPISSQLQPAYNDLCEAYLSMWLLQKILLFSLHDNYSCFFLTSNGSILCLITIHIVVTYTDGSILCLLTIHIVVTSKQHGCIICLVTLHIVLPRNRWFCVLCLISMHVVFFA